MPKLFRRILVPHDLSEHASRALRVAADLAAGRGGRLEVLHVVPLVEMVAFAAPVTGVPAFIPPPDMRERDRKQLEVVVRRVLGRRRTPKVRCRIVLGDPAQEIVQAARRADSIVMSTAGRTGLAHLVIGSVAEKVVRHSRTPVLTLPARSRAGGRGRRRRRA